MTLSDIHFVSMSRESNTIMLLPPLLIDQDYALYADEPVFDPKIHLDLTEPDFVVLLDGFQHVPKAPQLTQAIASGGESQLAYTGPFRILSNEGYRVLRMILQREMAYQICDSRHPSKIRFSAYRSKWIQDFNRCPLITEHLSRMTGDVQLMPTTQQSNYSHTNIGYAGADRVDAYHRDSVPYVLILLACDMSETIGGKLQLIERDPDEAIRLIEQYQGDVPEEFVKTIDYLGSNSCVFMQGSRIIHRVTGIESCREPRITVVNSYMSENPFATDYTRYGTFMKEKTAALEFVFHKLWRSNALMFDLASGKHSWPTVEQVTERLDKCIEELHQCRDLLTEKTSDQVGYYDEKTKKMSIVDAPPTLLKDNQS